MNRYVIISCLSAALGTSVAIADSYDPATNRLTVDSVQVGDTVYTSVVITVGSVISVGGSTPVSQTPSGRKYVFATTAAFTGDFGGTSAADAICANAAAAVHLGGTSWKAWLSDGTANAIDRINEVGPWYRPGTATVTLNTKTDLAFWQPATPILYNESGTLFTTNVNVWTGTSYGGNKYTSTCNNWQSNSFSDVGYIWTIVNGGTLAAVPPVNESTSTCNANSHLLCLGQ